MRSGKNAVMNYGRTNSQQGSNIQAKEIFLYFLALEIPTNICVFTSFLGQTTSINIIRTPLICQNTYNIRTHNGQFDKRIQFIAAEKSSFVLHSSSSCFKKSIQSVSLEHFFLTPEPWFSSTSLIRITLFLCRDQKI